MNDPIDLQEPKMIPLEDNAFYMTFKPVPNMMAFSVSIIDRLDLNEASNVVLECIMRGLIELSRTQSDTLFKTGITAFRDDIEDVDGADEFKQSLDSAETLFTDMAQEFDLKIWEPNEEAS